MKNDEKTIILGAGAVLTYLFLKGKEEKKEKKSIYLIFPYLHPYFMYNV